MGSSNSITSERKAGRKKPINNSVSLTEIIIIGLQFYMPGHIYTIRKMCSGIIKIYVYMNVHILLYRQAMNVH